MPAEERQSVPVAPSSNIIALGWPRLPRERRSHAGHDLRNLPQGVVPFRDPGPTWEETVAAAITPEMEAIFALIQALDHRTPSGQRSRKSTHDLVLQHLQENYLNLKRTACTKALERLVTLKWKERR